MRLFCETADNGLLVQGTQHLCIDIKDSDVRQAGVAHRRAKKVLDPLHRTKGSFRLR